MSFDLGSFLGGIIGGLITLIGVFLTINYYKKSEDKKFKIQVFSERPDLKIIEIENSKKPDLEMILIPIKGIKKIENNWLYLEFDRKYHNSNLELNYIDYYFANAGQTSISSINFMSSNQKNYTLYDFQESSTVDKIRNGDPNFEVLLDKRIDKADIIKIRMYHIPGIITNQIIAPIKVAVFDTSERIYSQAFFYPEFKIYSSNNYDGGYKQYRRDISIDVYMSYMIEKIHRSQIHQKKIKK